MAPSTLTRPPDNTPAMQARIYGNWVKPARINKVKKAKSLGLVIDEHLLWTEHVEEITKKISSVIGAIERIRPFISESTALQIYQALILPHFDYCLG